MGLSNAERQARWRAKRAEEIERLRTTPPPDRIAELEARIRELEVHLVIERMARNQAEAKAGATPKPPRRPKIRLSKKTRIAIISALHPDHAAHSTVESREEALKLFLNEAP